MVIVLSVASGGQLDLGIAGGDRLYHDVMPGSHVHRIHIMHGKRASGKYARVLVFRTHRDGAASSTICGVRYIITINENFIRRIVAAKNIDAKCIGAREVCGLSV